MFINPVTVEIYRQVMAENIECVRALIRKLPDDIRKFIDKGEEVIDESLNFQKAERDRLGRNDLLELGGLNVFHLQEDVPGDVMKHLAMLYAAGGWEHVSITCDRFWSQDVSEVKQVKFPNAITLRPTR